MHTLAGTTTYLRLLERTSDMYLLSDLAREYPCLSLTLAFLGAVSLASWVLLITRVLLQIFVIPGKSVRFSQAETVNPTVLTV